MVHSSSATPARDLPSIKDLHNVGSPAPASGKKRKSISSPGSALSPSSRTRRRISGASSPYNTPKHFKNSPLKSPIAKKTKNFREAEELTIRLNVYDLVWDKSKKGGNNNAGLVDLGLGFYHTGDLSFVLRFC
jgi:hypothetical protein